MPISADLRYEALCVRAHLTKASPNIWSKTCMVVLVDACEYVCSEWPLSALLLFV